MSRIGRQPIKIPQGVKVEIQKDKVKVTGGTVKVQITGALAQAQNLKEVETITNWAQTAQALVGPEMYMATAKSENVTAQLAQLMGIDATLVRSEQEKAQMAQQAQQMMLQQQGAANGTNGEEPSGSAHLYSCPGPGIKQ